MGLNPGSGYWMECKRRIKENKGSQMGHVENCVKNLRFFAQILIKNDEIKKISIELPMPLVISLML